MDKLNKYKTGDWSTVKIDSGFLMMVREYNQRTGLPISTIISEAIVKKMPKSILEAFERPSK